MPGSSSEHIKNIAVCMVLTLVTCGIYNVLGSSFVMDAIQQSHINSYYGHDGL